MVFCSAAKACLAVLVLAPADDGGLGDLNDKVMERVAHGDSFQAADLIVAGREPKDAARAFLSVAGDLYDIDKDLPASTLVARFGIQHCLSQAAEAAERDPDLCRFMKSAAMALSYNLASAEWPGWAEAKIEIGPTDLAIGLDAARLNLRLAQELDKGAVPIANGWWIVGAQLMAAHRLDEATDAFEQAERGYADGNEKAFRLMATGYVAMVGILRGDDGARAAFDKAGSDLRALDTDDSRFFADQDASVLKVFSEAPTD